MNVKRCVSKFLESNTFVLIKDDQAIIVDAGAELKDLGDIFAAMEKLEADYGVKFIVTCSAAKEDLPEFVLKYVD